MNRADKPTQPTPDAGATREAAGDPAAAGRNPPAARDGDVGGMPSTTDAGVGDRLGGRPAGSPAPADAGALQPRERAPRAGTSASDETAHTHPGKRRAAPTKTAAKGSPSDEGPLQSLGKAVSAPITGANTGRKRGR